MSVQQTVSQSDIYNSAPFPMCFDILLTRTQIKMNVLGRIETTNKIPNIFKLQ